MEMIHSWLQQGKELYHQISSTQVNMTSVLLFCGLFVALVLLMNLDRSRKRETSMSDLSEKDLREEERKHIRDGYVKVLFSLVSRHKISTKTYERELRRLGYVGSVSIHPKALKHDLLKLKETIRNRVAEKVAPKIEATTKKPTTNGKLKIPMAV